MGGGLPYGRPDQVGEILDRPVEFRELYEWFFPVGHGFLYIIAAHRLF
jgi:hypothetical protein